MAGQSAGQRRHVPRRRARESGRHHHGRSSGTGRSVIFARARRVESEVAARTANSRRARSGSGPISRTAPRDGGGPRRRAGPAAPNTITGFRARRPARPPPTGRLRARRQRTCCCPETGGRPVGSCKRFREVSRPGLPLRLERTLALPSATLDLEIMLVRCGHRRQAGRAHHQRRARRLQSGGGSRAVGPTRSGWRRWGSSRAGSRAGFEDADGGDRQPLAAAAPAGDDERAARY